MARSDNDSWDLASSVGATATIVAAARARATKAALIDDPFAEPLVRAVGVDFFNRWASSELDPADVDIPDSPWGVQPITDLLTARTRHIDSFFTEASNAGIRQAVILASGLDARGYRLPWPPGTAVFEIDQPAIIDFKAATLAALDAEPTADLRGVRSDLRHDWPAALRQAGFKPERPTAWSAEGLLAFLPPEAQDRLVDEITALSVEGSRLLAEVFRFSPETIQVMENANKKWYEHGLDVELDDLGYPGERSDVAAYLEANGWYTQSTPLEQLLAHNGLPTPSPGSAAASAFAEAYYCTAVLRSKTPAR
ncbi:class I SAM-dependent methyltransferase [Mycobacterium spongiae]|uniref:S-adenosyl-L-methionine-dependent methyltransferase n=1 Tax=Mycobacterium spongiae TaxID=886343 RepID=A0A975JVU0_9MYCO|nr:class I SAM-dependent methyltransferase [Mycobacterium spongiae]QUR66606.1 SAM-dependent methyltransferase [Mycobacterium spongiae]